MLRICASSPDDNNTKQSFNIIYLFWQGAEELQVCILRSGQKSGWEKISHAALLLKGEIFILITRLQMSPGRHL